MEIRDILIVLLIVLIAYLLYKTRNVEGFAEPTVSEMVRQAVSDTYLVDISAMRNLANISQSIMTNQDSLTLPTNINIPGDLTVDGNIFLTNRNTNLMNLLPKFMVIAWASGDGVPKGWAMCDGQKYKMDPMTGVVTALNAGATDPDMVITPDLRARFIVGAGAVKVDESNSETYKGGMVISGQINIPFGTRKGESAHVLTASEMASHFHYEFVNATANTFDHGLNNATSPVVNTMKHDDSHNYIMQSTGGADYPSLGKTSVVGNDVAHNNMPPYYALYYIMKL